MNKSGYSGPLERVGPCQWRIPKSYKRGMRVDGMIYADERLIDQIRKDQAPEQVANVATLPGIQHYSLAMPDIHWGYGFTIGGVAATDPREGGVISPGGVGYDINCGVRVVRSNLTHADVKTRVLDLVDELFRRIPSGVGRTGKYTFRQQEMRRVLAEGPRYLIEERGLGVERDLDFTEARGRLDGADPDRVSPRAFARGEEQCGTLGSGNHFLEVQVVDRVHDEDAARVMGLFEGQIVVLIHSGSRGLGYQVCDDSLAKLRKAPDKYGIDLPDRQLVCAPVDSDEGRDYIAAMRAAANFAWCNRQLLMQQTREVFADVFGRPWEALEMDLVYDVAHNIAKFERHRIGGVTKEVCVHRKGATRAFPAGHPEIPEAYRGIGQPVLIPGSMGTASWILVGQPGSMEQTFGTTCHGAGRQMSRTAAVKEARGRQIDRELAALGIIARARSRRELSEEQPKAYKDVDAVVDVVHKAGLSKKVVRVRPIGVIKG
jgi:tRNA-splicing ligase RtcB (3'-phosphate/5'-hydroxy nucleic acid ligase)